MADSSGQAFCNCIVSNLIILTMEISNISRELQRDGTHICLARNQQHYNLFNLTGYFATDNQLIIKYHLKILTYNSTDDC